MVTKVYTILWLFVAGDLAVCTVTPENEMLSQDNFRKSGRMKRERMQGFDKHDEVGVFIGEEDDIEAQLALLTVDDLRRLLVIEARDRAATERNEVLRNEMLDEFLQTMRQMNDAIEAGNRAADGNRQNGEQQNRRGSV